MALDHFIILDDSTSSKMMYQILLDSYSKAKKKHIFLFENELYELFKNSEIRPSGLLLIDRNLGSINAFDVLDELVNLEQFKPSEWHIYIMSALFANDDEQKAKSLSFKTTLVEKPLNKDLIISLESSVI